MNTLKHAFPFFSHNPTLVYLDAAATTPIVEPALQVLHHTYTTLRVPLHRSLYPLAETATALYETIRAQVAAYIGAENASCVAFVSNATDASNALAYGWAVHALRPGDRVVTTAAEHHATLLPWLDAVRAAGAHLDIVPYTDSYDDMTQAVCDAYTDRTRAVILSGISNVLGPYLDIRAIAHAARARGIRVFIDGSQMIAHDVCAVAEHGFDAFWYSSHKAYGPSGVGVLYLTPELHAQIHPYRRGGGMVDEAQLDDPRWLAYPSVLEAGTPALPEIVGHAAALEWLQPLLIQKSVAQQHSTLCTQLITGLHACDDRIHILGDEQRIMHEGHVVSFYHPTVHAHDIAAMLGEREICVRSGHHCAQPLHVHLGCQASVRVSFGVYSTADDVDRFLKELTTCIESIS